MSTVKAYELAKEIYAGIGVDTDKALSAMKDFTLSIHCWQGDDVGGFEHTGEALGGGIAATGNHPGKARTGDELRADIDKAFSLFPGKKKLGLHACYLEAGKKVDRDEVRPEHFTKWVDWAKRTDTGLDFNPTYFAHPKAADGLTLSHPDKGIRDFWIEHGIRSREISEYMGKETGKRCINNIWMPDGYKDIVYDKTNPRKLMIDSLDKILAKQLDAKATVDSLESKLFGLGSESYVTGSHEFYMGYCMKNPHVLMTLDSGHYHPTETVSAKISALMLFLNELLLHVSRPVRWDSDHVVIMDDELLAIAQEIVRGNYMSRVNVSLDYFDASINRVAAWAIGARNTHKAMLRAMLEPVNMLKKAEYAGDFTTRLAMVEELKSYPFAAVWDYYCEISNVPVRDKWLDEVNRYEKDVLSKR